MLKFVLATLAFVFFAATASAQVAIQDKPQLISDVPIYDMESEAEKQWAVVIPKLLRNLHDYFKAWDRLKNRHDDAIKGWFSRGAAASLNSIERRQYFEMFYWCGSVLTVHSPSTSEGKQKESAFKFAQLDVRVRVCEEKLSANPPSPAATPAGSKKKQ